MTDDNLEKTEKGLAMIKNIELQIADLKALNLDSSHQLYIRDVLTSLTILSLRLQKSIKKREQNQETKHRNSKSLRQ